MLVWRKLAFSFHVPWSGKLQNNMNLATLLSLENVQKYEYKNMTFESVFDRKFVHVSDGSVPSLLRTVLQALMLYQSALVSCKRIFFM